MAKIQKKHYFFGFLVLVLSISILLFLSARRGISEAAACNTSDFSGAIDLDQKTGIIDGKFFAIDFLAFGYDFGQEREKILGSTSGDEERWIDVDLSDQKLRAYQGSELFLETSISSGLAWWPTPKGEFRIWAKLRATKMEGGSGKYYYNLPNVPYVMFMENPEVPGYKGYGLHGTYWHNDFGTPRSHGCVNLPTTIAKELYFWTSPVMPEGKGFVKATSENPGTRVVVHD